MNSLELVRRLYEGGTDPETLAKELDESAGEELRQLLEAKEALEALPRRKPSEDVINAVVANAVQNKERKSPLTLLVMNRPLQRMAAAAIVVVAVGVGYLALRTDAIIPSEPADAPALSAESPAAAGERQALGHEPANEIAEMQAEPLQRSDWTQSKSAVPPAPETSQESGRSAFRRDLDEVGAMAGAAAPEEEGIADEDRFALLDAAPHDSPEAARLLRSRDAALADSAQKEEGDEAQELLSWDQEEQALRTFFWQVRALDGRSPAEEWEEAVPLEGSFEQLEKQQPGDRWLETGSQR